MSKPVTDDLQLKKAVREVLCELLTEDRELLRTILAEAAEEMALGELIMKGRKSKKKVSRRTVFKILEGQE